MNKHLQPCSKACALMASHLEIACASDGLTRIVNFNFADDLCDTALNIHKLLVFRYMINVR